jgi:hypothetical protein
MAVALVIMAAIQIGLIVIAMRSARQLTAAVEDLRREVRPLAEKVHRLTDEATRVTSLARMQVERVDEFLSTSARRMDETLSIVQNLIAGPIRQGATLITAVKAAMVLVRHWQSRPRPAEEHEEDALFVG